MRPHWLFLALLLSGCRTAGIGEEALADLGLAADLTTPPDLRRPLERSDPATWGAAGNNPGDYVMEPDRMTLFEGAATGHIRSRSADAKGFATWMSLRKPGALLGQRVRMAGYVKAQGVVGWSGMWMRVDGVQSKTLAFDNMMNRPIKGTSGFTRYEIVLDVDAAAQGIYFGLILAGPGAVWIGGVTFEIVDQTVPTTGF